MHKVSAIYLSYCIIALQVRKGVYDNGTQFDLFEPEGQNYIKIPSEDFSHNGMQANSLSQ